MIHIGIDPGQKGGIAFIDDGELHTLPMPQTNGDIFEALQIITRRGLCVAVLEQVGVMPGQGISSSGTFMRHAGALEMALTALGVPYVSCVPRRWQKVLQVPTIAPCSGSSAERAARKREHKNNLKAFAQRLYPAADVTLVTADAILLATYCARQDWRGVAA